jgi:uncharacterized protein (TIGR02271 family)
MAYETIVAVYDTADRAEQAVRALEAAGVPSNAITRHAGGNQTASASSAATTTRQEPGFWARLFGEEPEYQHEGSMFDRSVGQGSTVVSVRVTEEHTTRVVDILEQYNPTELDERTADMGTTSGRVGEDLHGAQSGIGGTGVGTRSVTDSGMSASVGSGGTGVRTDTDTSHTLAGGVASGGMTGREEAIPLSEEQIAVGKRAINRGTTRVRRYVVETPVEESVALRDERVTVDRRPVSGTRGVADDAFTDKTVEVSETTEEAVVSKTARVREEVVINKEATERTETVRDTVRREDVEITKDPDGTTGTGIGSTATNRVERSSD